MAAAHTSRPIVIGLTSIGCTTADHSTHRDRLQAAWAVIGLAGIGVDEHAFGLIDGPDLGRIAAPGLRRCRRSGKCESRGQAVDSFHETITPVAATNWLTKSA